MLAYRLALDPTPAQERALWSHAGAARVAFNWGLARVKASRRCGPDRRTGQRPSSRWQRASGALAKAQGRVADQRRDALHKATTGLAGRFGTIVVEGLHVRGMLANRHLARHVADASFGEFRRQAGR